MNADICIKKIIHYNSILSRFSTLAFLISFIISSESLESSHAPYKSLRVTPVSFLSAMDSVNFIINFFFDRLSSLDRKLKYFSIVLFVIANPIIIFFQSYKIIVIKTINEWFLAFLLTG